MTIFFSKESYFVNVDDFYYSYAEDSFLLFDSVVAVFDRFKPKLVVEIGSGSGYVISELLRKYPGLQGISTDISIAACNATKRYARDIGVSSRLQIICTSFDMALKKGRFKDVLFIFNPPYLPEDKSMDSMFSDSERKAYVGGEHGWETGFKMVEIAVNQRHAPIIIVFSTLSGSLESYLDKCYSRGFQVEVIKRLRFEFEELVTLLITKPGFFNN